MIYEINCGHCIQGFDTGAVGNGLKEQDLTRLVGNKVMQKLKLLGHTVIDCTVDSATSVSSALSTICAKANAVKAEHFVSIHFNASNGQGHGAEIFTYAGIETIQAINILKNIKALGYVNRGVKNGNHLAVINKTAAKAMLIECCFIDNAEDIKIFNADKMADAIVQGLTGQLVKPVVIELEVKVTKVKYCLEFQIWYNKVTQTTSPLAEDGVWVPATDNAYKLLDKLIRGTY